MAVCGYSVYISSTPQTTTAMNMIFDHTVGNSNTDLSKIVAFANPDGSSVTYWDNMTKDQAKQFFDEAMRQLMKYQGQVAKDAAGVLGALEDLYPNWVAEFEGEHQQ